MVPGQRWHSREIYPSSGCQPVLLEPVVAEHQHTEAAAAVQRALCHLLDDVGTQVQLLGPRLGVRGSLTGGLALLPAPFLPAPSVVLGHHSLCSSQGCGHLCRGSERHLPVVPWLLRAPQHTAPKSIAKHKGTTWPREGIDLAQGYPVCPGKSPRPNSGLLEG